ncbi:MAG: hypothetical protein AAGD06_29375 [Acidobacteriota bacterium]
MLRAVVNLDARGNGITSEKEINVGDNFDVIVTLYNDGECGEDEVEFDTFISEVWFNDRGRVVEMDLEQPPTAAELANNSDTTVDAFSLGRVKSDGFVHGEGTPLTRPDPTPEPAGARGCAQSLWKVGERLLPGYTEATGRAGVSDFGTPFRISTRMGHITAVAGRASVRKDARAIAEGKTHLVVSCSAFLGSKPVPVASDVATIHVVG